jgi:UDP-2-acetamido-3-amino-2,3-dideoxy-glucuronate N-acetyltransferase
MRVAVLGSGAWGQNLVRNFAELGVLAVICDRDEARLQTLGSRHGCRTTVSAADIWRDASIDAVAIATPPALHARMGLDAIAAGKHVLCEKPLAASLAEARALRDAARAAGVVHVVNFQLRFAAPYARAAELAPLIKKFLSPRGDVVYDNRTNTLYITDIE